MGLLIRTHALPVLSYRIPDALRSQVQPGAVVVAPLSGYSRLGVVVDVTDAGEHSRESLRGVERGLSISPALVEVCCELSDSFAVALPNLLRAAMLPGLNTGCYRIIDPAPDWPWKPGGTVAHTTLKRALGGDGLRAAEDEGRIRFVTLPPERKHVEWARLRPGANPDLGRAPRQRAVYEFLSEHGEGRQVQETLRETGASRGILRALARRGAIHLEERPAPSPALRSTSSAKAIGHDNYLRDAGRVVDRGGAWYWRVPTRECSLAVAASAEAAVEGGEQALVLVPEIDSVGRLVDCLVANLPEGYTVAPYHSGLDGMRAVVYEETRNGHVDVLVGTRTAALLPLARPGVICVVDEPNGSHCAASGYEGLQIHAREIALARGRAEDCGVLLLSPVPSLRISAPVSRVKELPAPPTRHWPAARIVDMRGSGAVLSSALVEVCRSGLEQGKRIALVANRLGYATSVSCSHCGGVRSCPNCDLPLSSRESSEVLTCTRCGYCLENSDRCQACGSGRVRPAGFAIDRLHEEVSRTLDVAVGKLTAADRENENAQIIVATARFVTGDDWGIVVVPDADALLLGSGMGAVERAFRILYGASEAARDLILVQTRQPEHYALQAALRGDYPSFAATELPRLRNLGYPPYGHLAALVLEGEEEPVRRAVELGLRPSLEPEVSMSAPIPLARQGEKPVWRVLLRSPDQKAAARAGVFAARIAAKTQGANGLVARVEIDPEEV